MDKNLISCIVPVYNGECFLDDALDSILAQSYQPLEVIVVDDGSTDNTAKIAHGFGDRILYQWQPNRGSASARNHGLGLAGGEFVAFLDADDLWLPEKLSRQMAVFRDHPNTDLCFTQFRNFWIPDREEEARQYADHPLSTALSAWSIATLLAHRTTFERFGLFDEELRGNENMLWFLNAARKGARIEMVNEVLMLRRFHWGNASRLPQDRSLELLLPILKAWRDYKRDEAEAGDSTID
jgi:glycosyltransferase involved in cell wall biosynthesis